MTQTVSLTLMTLTDRLTSRHTFDLRQQFLSGSQTNHWTATLLLTLKKDFADLRDQKTPETRHRHFYLVCKATILLYFSLYDIESKCSH